MHLSTAARQPPRSTSTHGRDRGPPRLRAARTIFQVIDKCCSTLPGLELGGKLSIGTRADGPEALSKLATVESVATGGAAFKYVTSLVVALLMYPYILVL